MGPMPKQHRAKGRKLSPPQVNGETTLPELPTQEAQEPEKEPGENGPQYPSELNPERPYLDHEPAMRWELRELEHRLSVLEAALSIAPESEGEGEAASAPA